MKISMYITNNAVQFNLSPENSHEKKFVGMLNEYQGEAFVTAGLNLGMTMGNYLRSFSGDTVAITIRKEKTND